MMVVINYHVKIMSTIALIRQINPGMQISNRTDPHKKGSMEWRGVVDEIQKLESGLELPEALRYSVIRKLKDNYVENWDHSERGTELTPHTIILDPWGPLEKNACSFIDSFLWDIWIYWIQVLFGTVIIGILSSG